ncbi:MAG TPA: lipocalin-like domain-containing protein [Candidatus Eisenbacteria bacterium]|nr:lipocalin-like domain-containing protein [Candidatus Eisenbacteria bacterium]
MKPEPLPPPSADLASEILGAWWLLSRLDDDDTGNRHVCPILGAQPLGFLSFAPKRFSAQFMRRGRELEGEAPASTAASPPGANNTAAVGGYDAYFGTYELDATRGTVIVKLEASLAPANIGKTFVREVRVVGGRLIIRLNTNAADGTPISRTLTFERLA